jgi:hypothetical protein
MLLQFADLINADITQNGCHMWPDLANIAGKPLACSREAKSLTW